MPRRRARPGSEVGLQARIVHVPPPSDEAGFVTEGGGGGVAFSYRPEAAGSFEGDIYYELAFERSSHEEEATRAAADYLRATAGLRLADARSDLFQPYLALGLSYHDIEASGGRWFSGTGLYAGGGVEFLLGRAATVLLEAKFHVFFGAQTADGTTPFGASAVLAAAAGVRF
jgi:hypothetical protein